ncbi:MAG TPA: hypothetical protein VJ302_37700 [Blastocatellia bacterium]|nr:hypothetical protein [Blastocatellia bacterium]
MDRANPKFSAPESEILRALETALKNADVAQQVDRIVAEAERKLARNTGEAMAWEVIPLSLYGESLPDGIQSSWVFVIRARAVTGAERHPNSIQRAMSYRRSGDLQVREDGVWRSNLLVSDPDADLEQKWVSIPVNVWHQVVVGDRDWVVVSFHTVPEDQLIEERHDPADPNSTRRRRYLERAGSSGGL